MLSEFTTVWRCVICCGRNVSLTIEIDLNAAKVNIAKKFYNSRTFLLQFFK